MSDETPTVDVSAIKEHGLRASEQSSTNLTAVEGRLSALELALEHVGRQSELVVNLNEYVEKLSRETTQLSWIRLIVLGVSAVFLILLNSILLKLLFFNPFYFFVLGPTTRVAVISSVVAGSIFLLTIVVKGVFRSLADRHAEDNLPPHLKEALELVKGIIKPNGS